MGKGVSVRVQLSCECGVSLSTEVLLLAGDPPLEPVWATLDRSMNATGWQMLQGQRYTYALEPPPGVQPFFGIYGARCPNCVRKSEAVEKALREQEPPVIEAICPKCGEELECLQCRDFRR